MSLLSQRGLTQWKHYPWVVWGLGSLFFFLMYIGRVSIDAYLDTLQKFFQVGADQVSYLQLGFMVAYVSIQIPVGALVDRYGPQRLLLVTVSMSMLSLILFAFSGHFWVAILSRVILGFSGAFAFICTLKLATMWFPSSRLGVLSALTQVMGMLGAAVGVKGSDYLEVLYGWQSTNLIIASSLFVLAVLVFILVKEQPKSTIQKNQITSMKDVVEGLKLVLRNPQSWFNASYAGFIYLPSIVLGELWGTMYFVNTRGLERGDASTALSLMFIGWAVGGIIMGWLSDRMKRRKPLLYFSSLSSLAVILIIMYGPQTMSFNLIELLIVLFGFFNAGLVNSYAISGELNPKPIAGLSIAFCNMISVLFGTFIQVMVGIMLEYNWDGQMMGGKPVYQAGDFQWAMIWLPLSLGIAFIMACFIKETHCRSWEERQNA
ncbi:MAG TPA: MFS transporter [Gammaproteobacteria bacterium]|nr:MFS transporter [Gammaproteobacteria bacterium]